MELGTRLFVLLALLAGFYAYIRVARRSRTEDIDGFFLGGRNINSTLFENATWGTSYALNNGIYWGIFFGYTVGFSAVWINGAWALGFVGLSLIIPRLLKPTERFTLHGYLGSRYGSAARVMASICSTTTMLLNIGAEIVFAALFLSAILGLASVSVVVIVAIAMFSAVFCSIGGYKANAAIDRYQNILSTACLVFLLFLVCTAGLRLNISPTVTSLLAVGLLSTAALGVVMLRRKGMTQKGLFARHENVLLIAALAACAAIGVSTGKTPDLVNPERFVAQLTSIGENTPYYVAGVVVFQFFYQFVDTANWQNISAHRISLSKNTSANPISRALREASLKILLAPILLTTLIGASLRSLNANIKSSDATFMVDLIQTIQPVASPLLAAALLGLLTFVFVGAARSGIDSWVMAATQTLSWDILDHKTLQTLEGLEPPRRHERTREIVRRAKGLLFAITGVGAALYFGLFWLTEGKIIALFSLIFSAPLVLLPSLMFALYGDADRLGKNGSAVAVTSMLGGYLAPLVLLGLTTLFGPIKLQWFVLTQDVVLAVAPFVALGTSLALFLLGWSANIALSRPALQEEASG